MLRGKPGRTDNARVIAQLCSDDFRTPHALSGVIFLVHYRLHGRKKRIAFLGYVHLLFHTLQQSSRFTFDAEWNAPLPIINDPIASVRYLMPDYYPRQTPRLVSCYALFK